ncbi:hypothetical protein BJ742DRAFT_103479 [Cladochytrium replicatum]|nr:hypothetical protein BJ742DRAFT_103479 [Cladochytrium replicatum]
MHPRRNKSSLMILFHLSSRFLPCVVDLSLAGFHSNNLLWNGIVLCNPGVPISPCCSLCLSTLACRYHLRWTDRHQPYFNIVQGRPNHIGKDASEQPRRTPAGGSSLCGCHGFSRPYVIGDLKT